MELAERTCALLTELTGAAIAAVSETGFFVPLPGSVPLHGQSTVNGHRSALELVAADDLRAAITAWQEAHLCGYAEVTVRSAADDDQLIAIRYVDARAVHGVFLCFLLGELTVITERQGDAGAIGPRVSIVRKDQRAVFLVVDAAAEEILGHTDLVGRSSAELIHPDDAPRAVATWMNLLASPGQSRRSRLRQQHRDGHWIWFEITNHNRLDDPDLRCVVSEMIDISEEIAIHEFVRVQEELLRRLTDSLPVGVLQIDDHGLIVHRNARLTEIVGNPGATHFHSLFSRVNESQLASLTQALADTLDGGSVDLDITLRRGEGTITDARCHLILRPLQSPENHGALICVDDVTQAAAMQDELRKRATYDQLTGCHNRASVLAELEQALSISAGPDDGVVAIYLDLDGFKSVNDRFGHPAGDLLLTEISQCLFRSVRATDVVGRMGGDEFLIVGTGFASENDALAMAYHIRSVLAESVEPTPGHLAIVSIGVAWASGGSHGHTAEQLVSGADAAMYRSKQAGAGIPILAMPAAEVSTAST